MNCHYSLTGLTGPAHRCPECGREFDPNDRRTFLTDRQPLTKMERRAIVCAVMYAVFFGLNVIWLRIDSAPPRLGLVCGISLSIAVLETIFFMCLWEVLVRVRVR